MSDDDDDDDDDGHGFWGMQRIELQTASTAPVTGDASPTSSTDGSLASAIVQPP